MSDNRLTADRKDNLRSVMHFEQLDFSHFTDTDSDLVTRLRLV